MTKVKLNFKADNCGHSETDNRFYVKMFIPPLYRGHPELLYPEKCLLFSHVLQLLPILIFLMNIISFVKGNITLYHLQDALLPKLKLCIYLYCSGFLIASLNK